MWCCTPSLALDLPHTRLGIVPVYQREMKPPQGTDLDPSALQA